MKLVTSSEQVNQEHVRLSEDASFSDETEGRARSGETDLYRTEYQRDRDKILHTKAFRRLSHKPRCSWRRWAIITAPVLPIRWRWRRLRAPSPAPWA